MAAFNRRKPKTRFPSFARAARDPAAAPAPRPLRRRGMYLLPNGLTTAALFSGFYAIVQAMNHDFYTAAVAIFVAMVLDSLDGRVARMTHTQSDFGAEFDSLSDMVAFGIAPALVVYEWALLGLGKPGWLAAFVYVSGTALRLARFNTNLAVVDKRFFQGLPSPAAAALVAGFVWIVVDDGRYSGPDVAWVAWFVTIYAGLSMVSNSPFYSFKVINLRKSVPFFAILLIVLAFIITAADPPKVLFALFVVFGLSGHFVWVVRQLRRRRAAPTVAQTPDQSK